VLLQNGGPGEGPLTSLHGAEHARRSARVSSHCASPMTASTASVRVAAMRPIDQMTANHSRIFRAGVSSMR
jgi:hypothetical protein